MRGRSLTIVLVLIFAAAAAHADIFRILDDSRDAAQARVDIIQQAHSEIHALYFIARNDRITLAALELLCEAKRRGVPSVRLVVDANFSNIPKAVLAHLHDEGVQVRVYHPITLRHPSWLVRRMHEKVIVVDGARYITGGRNLAEPYFDLAKKNYVDRDVYVEGASAADADAHFENIWSSGHVADLDVHVFDREKRKAADRLAAAVSELRGNGYIALNTGRNWSEGQKDAGVVRFLKDPVDDEHPRVAATLDEIFSSAKKSIVVESPYLIPSKSVLELLERKAAEGVEVVLLTNSLRSSDGVLPFAGYLKYRRRLVRAGINVHEYKGPDMLHAKSAVVDGRIAMVGSYNLDPRSENLNTEVMCVAEDEEAARVLLASIHAHLENSWTVKKRERVARAERVSRGRAFRAWAVRLFIVPLIENQL
jgi:cardiolipin synthase C